MSLSDQKRDRIERLLVAKIDEKLESYGRETASMPFLARLIQDSEKIAAYSFIHSLATSLGMSIYEEVSVILADGRCEEAFRNYGVGGVISPQQKQVIGEIVQQLRNGSRAACIEDERSEVLQASTEGGAHQKSGNVADFYMKKNGELHFFEIKTAKPNIDVFKESKTKLLEWIARTRQPAHVYLALPYNPYHPDPYERFTESNMMDHPNDFLIGDEYWDFIGGGGAFRELLDVFDAVGRAYKDRLNEKFADIARERIDSY